MNNCRSVSSATSSARCAELSTATTTQTIATATMTPIGTTTLRRRWLQPNCLRASPISDRAAAKCRIPKDYLGVRIGRNDCVFACGDAVGQARAQQKLSFQAVALIGSKE